MFLIYKNVTIPCLASLHVHDSLIGLSHGHIVVPGLDALFSKELEHVFNLLWTSDLAASDLDAFADQGIRVEAWNWIFGSSYLDKGAVELQELQVSPDRHLWTAHCGYDNVKATGVLPVPLGVFVCCDEIGCTHSKCVFFFPRCPGDGDDSITSKRSSSHDTEMAKTADADYTDLLAFWTDVSYLYVASGDGTHLYLPHVVLVVKMP